MTRSRRTTIVGFSILLMLLAAVSTPLALRSAKAAGDEPSPDAAQRDARPPDEPVEPDDAAKPPDPKLVAAEEEPPLEFRLDVDGKATDVQLDRPATIEVNGKRVEVRLTAKPDRLFRGGGVTFRYPRQHGFQVERDPDDDLTTWTLDGNNNVLILLHYPAALDAEDLGRDIVEPLVTQYGKANCRTSPASIALGERTVKGTRVDVAILGESLIQEVFAWQDGDDGPSYVLIVQDTPPEAGRLSDESKQVLALLGKTFKHEAR